MTDDLLTFKDADELLELAHQAAARHPSDRKSLRKLRGFASALDIYLKARQADGEAEVRTVSSAVLSLDRNPLYAWVANADGEVRIGDRVYNVLSPQGSAAVTQLVSASCRPINRYEINGYYYNETSECWNDMCSYFPCNLSMTWPGYATYADDRGIPEGHIVIQVWKGYCKQAGGRISSQFPGGYGAEVGVYWWEKVPGNWWPYTGWNKKMNFTLSNKSNGKTFFHSRQRRTWWLNQWMEAASYKKWEKRNGRTAMKWACDYTLEYNTGSGGVRKWVGHKGGTIPCC